jgi:hypothetical protein
MEKPGVNKLHNPRLGQVIGRPILPSQLTFPGELVVTIVQAKDLPKSSVYCSAKLFYGQNEQKETKQTTRAVKRSDDSMWHWDCPFTFPVHSTRAEWVSVTVWVRSSI